MNVMSQIIMLLERSIPTRERLPAYLFHIVQNHPFVDGNKRSGTVAALLFLELNNFGTDAPAGSIYELTITVANGLADKSMIAEFSRSQAITP